MDRTGKQARTTVGYFVSFLLPSKMALSVCGIFYFFLIFSFSLAYEYYYDLQAARERHQSYDYWAATDLPTDSPTDYYYDYSIGPNDYEYEWIVDQPNDRKLLLIIHSIIHSCRSVVPPSVPSYSSR